MSKNSDIELLFKEHSPEEIEAVRDNLGEEIEKRTDQLKSIVKEKYRDIVETSDAIQTIKQTLKGVDSSFRSLDGKISKFYDEIRAPTLDPCPDDKQSDRIHQDQHHIQALDDKLFDLYCEIWESFDSNDLETCVKCLSAADNFIKHNDSKSEKFEKIKKYIERSRDMIKNSLWYRIKTAEPDRIGIIAGCNQNDLYEISLKCCADFLRDELKAELSDMSFHAQIRRYRPVAYFDTKTNSIDPEKDDLNRPATGYIPVPKFVSPELDNFMFGTCRAINTIAGFNLNRSSIVGSLKLTIETALGVYSELIDLVEALPVETRRKRSLQLYFDLLYLQALLNDSNDLELIDKLDPEFENLSNRFKAMVDAIELCMISEEIRSNITKLSESTIRLYGLLIPHLT